MEDLRKKKLAGEKLSSENKLGYYVLQYTRFYEINEAYLLKLFGIMD